MIGTVLVLRLSFSGVAQSAVVHVSTFLHDSIESITATKFCLGCFGPGQKRNLKVIILLKNADRILSPFSDHEFVAKKRALSQIETCSVPADPILRPVFGHESAPTFDRNLGCAGPFFAQSRGQFCSNPNIGRPDTSWRQPPSTAHIPSVARLRSVHLRCCSVLGAARRVLRRRLLPLRHTASQMEWQNDLT